MKLVRKHSKVLLILLGIVALYFILRLPNLTLQPIFADEAIYIRWAQVMRAEPTLRFVSLSDGKTPLFMWLMIPLFKFIHDPLLAGRFLSVISGFFTMLGVFALGWRVFNPKVALWSALIYTIVPYTVFFDRMALVDAMLAAFLIWALYFALWLLKSQRLDLAMILGYLFGGALLVKTPAMLGILTLPATLVGFNFKNSQKYALVKLLGLWLVAIGIALIIYNILRLGPNFAQLSSRNQDYIFSPVEILARPLDPFIPHLRDMIDWFPKLFTWSVIVLGIIGVIRVIKEKNKIGVALLAWGLVPLLIQMALLKTFTARYLLFSITPFLVLAGYGMYQVSNIKNNLSKAFLSVVALLLLIPAVYFDYLLLTNPQNAPLPKEERQGYFEDWTAGYGFKEIANFLIEQRKQGKVLVGTEGFFGTLPDGLYIYLDKVDITVVGSGPIVSNKIREATSSNQVYFVANKKRLQASEKLKLIKEFPKAKPLGGGDQDAIQLFQVLP